MRPIRCRDVTQAPVPWRISLEKRRCFSSKDQLQIVAPAHILIDQSTRLIGTARERSH
jgi:hypothetical protein